MKTRDYVFFVILLALAAAFPFMGVPRYIIASTLLLFCYATVVSQWNLVFGIAGIFSLAQLAIFAFGAYSTALMGRYLDWSLWPTFPIAGAAGVIFSIFIGLACLRMRGIYVALLTLAISQTMFRADPDRFGLQRAQQGDQPVGPAWRSPAARRGSATSAPSAGARCWAGATG